MGEFQNISIAEKIEIRYGDKELKINDIYEVTFVNDKYEIATITGKLLKIFKNADEYYIKINSSASNIHNAEDINVKYISYIDEIK